MIVGDLPASAGGGVPADWVEVPVDVLIELNVLFPGSVGDVAEEFVTLWSSAGPTTNDGGTGSALVPVRVSDRLYQAVISRPALRVLIAADRDPRS